MRHSFHPIVVNGGSSPDPLLTRPADGAESDTRWQRLTAFGYLLALAAMIIAGIITTAIVVKQVVDPLLAEPPFVVRSR